MLSTGWPRTPRCTVSFFDTSGRSVINLVLAMGVLIWMTASCSAITDEASPVVNGPITSEWSSTTTNGAFKVTVSPRSGEVRIGQFQVWHLRLVDADGQTVFPARFAIGGGMLGHSHGLPTQPRVTGFAPEGYYIIEGMKFNMAGEWTIYLTIEAEVGSKHQLRSDQAQINIDVDY